MEADGHLRPARAQGMEHRRVRRHRLLRAVRVHGVPAPAQDVLEAPQTHRRVLRHVPRLHGRVRVLVRQLVARRLGSDGHADGHRPARARRLRYPGHMHPGLHAHFTQYYCSSNRHPYRQLRRILRGAHAVPHPSPSELISYCPHGLLYLNLIFMLRSSKWFNGGGGGEWDERDISPPQKPGKSLNSSN